VDFPAIGQQQFFRVARSGKITFSPLETKKTFLQNFVPFFWG